MSIRAFGARLFRHGTAIVRHYCRRDYNTRNIADKINSAQGQVSKTSDNVIHRNFAWRNVGLQFSAHARRIFIDNVLNRVTNSLAAELRKKAARRILFGDSGPFFALVGVSLASGTGIITKEEELEGICWEIREAISKIKWKFQDDRIDESHFERDEAISLKDLSLGQPIAKGANAVVYTVKLNEEQGTTVNNDTNVVPPGNFGTRITARKTGDSIAAYPLALKMMFNYDIQSNAMSILQAMYKETVPARQYANNIGVEDWELRLSKRKRSLPPHPNVVAIYSVFADYVPELQDARSLFPAALPSRIYPDGDGRNMSLFLLMKRYDCSLQQYLSETQPPMRTSFLLLAQLLEGVAHLVAHGIAHRDLKSDNILLDMSEEHVPVLIISDFGCCLADKTNGLYLPYTSYEIDKGGNTALMAPEIITQTPGTFSVLNYTKSDLWAAGTIAYEIFGLSNPFYDSAIWRKLKNVDYTEERLPDLPEEVPGIIKSLVRNLLDRNPNNRLHPEVAANVCQLFLWAPSAWLKSEMAKIPSSAEILQWLLSLTTKVLCESRLNTNPSPVSSPGDDPRQNIYKGGRRTYPEYLLISSFLCRAKLTNIKAALTWIHDI